PSPTWASFWRRRDPGRAPHSLNRVAPARDSAQGTRLRRIRYLIVVVAIAVSAGEAPCLRVDQDLAGLSVLQSHGLDEAALTDEQDVRVTVRLQLLANLRFGDGSVAGDEHGAPGLRRGDQRASSCNEHGSTDQCHDKSTIHGLLH